MYTDLNNNYEYYSIGLNWLSYKGEYKGDIKFVDGFIERGNDAINIPSKNHTGEEYLFTALESAAICKNTATRYEDKISEGRNFIKEDFLLQNRDDNISIILGNDYKGIYNLGGLTSRYIKITDDTKNISTELQKEYESEFEELAAKNNLKGIYIYPIWAAGIIW
ncbi:MAG: hypothetical protein ACK5LT_02030 [Lachnospirales bacterium]